MKRRKLTPEEIEDIEDRQSEREWKAYCRAGDTGDFEAREDERAQKLLEYRELRGDFERDPEDDE